MSATTKPRPITCYQQVPRRPARPALPYKFKFKFSGAERLHQLDPALGLRHHRTGRHIRADEALARKWVAKNGVTKLVTKSSHVPDAAIQLKDANAVASDAHITGVKVSDSQAIEIDNKNCVRCMHCINVMTGGCRSARTRRHHPDRRQERVKIAHHGFRHRSFMPLNTEEDFGLSRPGPARHGLLCRKCPRHERTAR